MKALKRTIFYACRYVIEICSLPILMLIAIYSRFAPKKFDVGIGPEPIISHIYHKRTFNAFGYTAQTFVSTVYFITDEFDVRGDKLFRKNYLLNKTLIYYYLYAITVLRYRCIYIYFNGGALGLDTLLLWRVEPLLYKLAKVKVVVMPYGGDVQDITRCSNFLYKHAISKDYPLFKLRRGRIAAQIDLWTRYADHMISGCDWVDYMYHWDTLMLGHFSIDIEDWKPIKPANVSPSASTKLRILHAPNHRTIKGTQFFIDAVDALTKEGVPVELVILERVPNTKIKEVMSSVDVVADQLIIGWYAMFAIEAMALEKPVLCNLRQDFEELFIVAGIIAPNEIPIIRCTPLTIKEAIRELALNKQKLAEIGRQSREFVIRHHSLQSVGKVFDKINRSMGIQPTNANELNV
ncbi:MAG: hypothetical protein U0350_25310 [Caldilineaceae bacterium]